MLGGTGAVGSALVRELLASPFWTRVLMLVRRPTDLFAGDAGASRLTVAVIDMAHLERDTHEALGDPAWTTDDSPTSAFCTMGIGQPRKVPREEFRRVDIEYAAAFARACKAAGVTHFSLLGSVGANTASRTHYLRVKGEAEDAVRAAGIARTSLFRPSQLMTDEIRYGLQDRVAQSLFPRISRLLPAKYREVHVAKLARAMRINAERTGTQGVEILHWPEFRSLLDPARA